MAACNENTVYHSYQSLPNEGWGKSDTPVSYTHLDVYKRQLLAKGKEGKEEKQNDFSLRIGLQR